MSLDSLSIASIRCCAVDVVQKPNSGHPGAPLGMAPAAHILFNKIMTFDPNAPSWINRDRFVLSNGHASALLYTMLHLCGYGITVEELQSFRSLGSRLPGHPENFLLPGVEVTTGPLGQGISNSVGIAMAEKHLAARFNKPDFPLLDHHVFCFCGDGCLQEGVSSEACSLAGHLGLDNLIVIWDDNRITIDGDTSLSFTEDVPARFRAYGWNTRHIVDGNGDLAAIEANIRAAMREAAGKPTLIRLSTMIGFGSISQGTHKVHGSPLGAQDIAQLKSKFGLDPSKFYYIPDEVYAYYKQAIARGVTAHAQWDDLLCHYREAFPAEAREFDRLLSGKLPQGWEQALPKYTAQSKPEATRKISETVLNALAPVIPELVGGSCDLTPSTLTYLKCSKDFQRGAYDGRYFRFGIREHGMAAIVNGIAAYGGNLIPFGSTFLVFTGYALGAIRISALSHRRVIYVFTHDSIGVGEDGPTHQPVETYLTLRALPNMTFLRPADGNEVSGAYALALTNEGGPTTIALTRQNVTPLAGSTIEGVRMGMYVVHATGTPAPLSPTATPPPADVILVASGSEVGLCVEAAKTLEAEQLRVRVVSAPSLELFDRQSLEYRRAVLGGAPVVSVEAGTTRGWAAYSHTQMGIDAFGYSGPAQKVFEKFGLTGQNVAERARKLLNALRGQPLPLLPVLVAPL